MSPSSDWLWPAIWMLPVDSAYGAWPASGEIDVSYLSSQSTFFTIITPPFGDAGGYSIL